MLRTVANGAALTIAQEVRAASRRGGTFDQSQEEPRTPAQVVQCDDGAAPKEANVVAQVEVAEQAPFPQASPSTVSPNPMVADGVARCYLVFSPVSQGTLYAQWLHDAATSDVREADVLACFVPAKPPPPFKMKHGGGRSELMREVGGPKKSRYYEGWTHFIKSAKSMGGEVTVLRNLDALSVAIYLLTDASEVRRLAIGDQVQLQGVLAAAAIPGASSGFEGCHTINSNVFHQTAAASGGAGVAL